MYKFYFDGRRCDEFDIVISGEGTFSAPERDVTMIDVPGRNGALHIDNGRFKNITVSYPAVILSHSEENIRNMTSWLLNAEGYKRLEDDYHPDVFRLARFISPLDIEMRMVSRAAKMTLQFDCKPQRFLKSGEDIYSFYETGYLWNPTSNVAKPKIVAYGNGGAGAITINGKVLMINSWRSSAQGDYVVIDSELMDAYNIAGNCNNTITGEFPELKPGENEVAISGGVTSIDIVPRWWRL